MKKNRVAILVPQTHDGNSIPSLGPLYLVAMLEKNGFISQCFDMRLDSSALKKLVLFQPDVIGLSSVTAGFNLSLEIAKNMKKRFPRIFTVLGGPHPSALPREAANSPFIDFVLTGEGENNFLHLCEILRDGNNELSGLKNVYNLFFLRDGKFFETEKSKPLSSSELDNLPFPAFHRMNLSEYFKRSPFHGLFQRGKRILPMMTTRGCPGSCTFCCRVMGNSIRLRSVDSVLEEIRFMILTYGVDEIFFEDDNFTFNRNRALEILEAIAKLEKKVNIKIANGVRVDKIDDELILAMKRAGAYCISFGIESGCERTLRRMKKCLSLELVKEKVALAKSRKILVGINCIIGYPEETVKDIEESISFLLKLKPDSMAIVNLVPFPGTEVRETCEENFFLTKEAENWDNYYFSIYNPVPLIETPYLSKKQLINCVHKAYRRMYFQPLRFLKILGNFSWPQIIQSISFFSKKTQGKNLDAEL